jgi:UDP-N-acetylmuramate--alanine ligase
MVGIGGIGMSGIAEILLHLGSGIQVTGSDAKLSGITERLASLGAEILEGHCAVNVEGADLVVTSSAVRKDNPEVVAARHLQIPIIPRAEMLAELMRLYRYGIAIAGSHGKTTTTSMIAAVLARGGLDPTIVVGGRLKAIGSNARLGHGQFLVAEADESDGSFLRLNPAVSVITNIDREHLDYYSGLDALRQAFVYFANRVPFYGVTVLCADDPEVRAILPLVTKRATLYGTDPSAEVRATSIELVPHGSRFRLSAAGRDLGAMQLQVPGGHNVLNALAAAAVGLEVGVGFGHIAESLAQFHGVGRRFETRGEAGGVRVVDDYGHHPTEIRATLAAARTLGGRVLVLFQPHRYSRTSLLREEFGAAFADAERVWVLDVYAAGEAPIAGVTGRTIVEAAERRGASHLAYAPEAAAAVAEAAAAARPGDTVLTLGAGDVWRLGDDVLSALKPLAAAGQGRER